MACDRVGRYTINIRRMTRSKRPRSQFHSVVTTLHLHGLAAYPKLELQSLKIDEIGASIQSPTPATFRLFVQPRRSCLALLRLTFKHGFRSVSHIAVDLRHVLSTAQHPRLDLINRARVSTMFLGPSVPRSHRWPRRYR